MIVGITKLGALVGDDAVDSDKEQQDFHFTQAGQKDDFK